MLPKQIEEAKLSLTQSSKKLPKPQQKPLSNISPTDISLTDPQLPPLTEDDLTKDRDNSREMYVSEFDDKLKATKDDRLLSLITEKNINDFTKNNYGREIAPEFYKGDQFQYGYLLNAALKIAMDAENLTLKEKTPSFKKGFYPKILKNIEEFLLKIKTIDAPSAGVPLVASKGRKRMTSKELKQHLQSRKTIPKQTPYNLKQTIFDILKS